MFKYIANIYKLFLFSNTLESGASNSKNYTKAIDLAKDIGDSLSDLEISAGDSYNVQKNIMELKKVAIESIGKTRKDIVSLELSLQKTLLDAMKTKGIILKSGSSVQTILDTAGLSLNDIEPKVLAEIKETLDLSGSGVKIKYNESTGKVEISEKLDISLTSGFLGVVGLGDANATEPKIPEKEKPVKKNEYTQQEVSNLVSILESTKLLDKKGCKITIQDGKVFITTGLDSLTKINISEKALKKGQHLTSFAINKDNFEKYLKDGNLQKLIDKKIAKWEKIDKKKD